MIEIKLKTVLRERDKELKFGCCTCVLYMFLTACVILYQNKKEIPMLLIATTTRDSWRIIHLFIN